MFRTDKRIYIADTTVGNAAQQVGKAVIFGQLEEEFGLPYGDDGLLSLVTDDACDTYLALTGSDSVNGWWGEPTDDDGLPVSIIWRGSGGDANAAIRIGTSNATST